MVETKADLKLRHKNKQKERTYVLIKKKANLMVWSRVYRFE